MHRNIIFYAFSALTDQALELCKFLRLQEIFTYKEAFAHWAMVNQYSNLLESVSKLYKSQSHNSDISYN